MDNDQGYHKLIIWQKSKKFLTTIYKLANLFPKSEEYNLISQLKRATLSVLLNIVEGHRRRNFKQEFIRFLYIADGSLTEVEACLEVSLELGFITKFQFDEVNKERSELAGMLMSFIKQVKTRTP